MDVQTILDMASIAVMFSWLMCCAVFVSVVHDFILDLKASKQSRKSRKEDDESCH